MEPRLHIPLTCVFDESGAQGVIKPVLPLLLGRYKRMGHAQTSCSICTIAARNWYPGL